MHRTRFVFGLTALFLATGIVVTADQGHGGSRPQHQPAPHPAPAVKPAAAMQPKAMKPATSPKATKPATAPKTIKPPAASKAVKPVAQKPVTPAAAKNAKPAPPQVKTAKSDKTPAVKVAKTEKAKVPATAPTATTTNVALTPVQQKLQKNTNLASKLTSRLPPGTDLMTASSGFRNLGQFVAAVNVSNNLGIPFDQLKTKMVTDGRSLGQSIQSLKPVASATVEAQHAEYDARGMIADSEREMQSAPAPATTTTTKSKTKTKKPAQ